VTFRFWGSGCAPLSVTIKVKKVGLWPIIGCGGVTVRITGTCFEALVAPGSAMVIIVV
jgi:hypothetical protein